MHRRTLLTAAVPIMNLRSFAQQVDTGKPAARAPVLFIGHGSPMNIVRDNAFTRSLGELGRSVEKPRAVLVVSAHWLTPGEVRVCVNPKPRTIYDFGGFPEELYKVAYAAPGDPDTARTAAAEVKSLRVHEDHEMGLDHGAWSVLVHLWPKADIPVFQLSIDYAAAPAKQYALGRELRALRDRGVLILGSGNIVHNLRRIQPDDAPPFDWAREFDDFARARLLARDDQALVDYASLGPAAALAVPTPDHYQPLLHVLGALHEGEAVRFTHESFQNGSISMRCFQNA